MKFMKLHIHRKRSEGKMLYMDSMVGDAFYEEQLRDLCYGVPFCRDMQIRLHRDEHHKDPKVGLRIRL